MSDAMLFYSWDVFFTEHSTYQIWVIVHFYDTVHIGITLKIFPN